MIDSKPLYLASLWWIVLSKSTLVSRWPNTDKYSADDLSGVIIFPAPHLVNNCFLGFFFLSIFLFEFIVNILKKKLNQMKPLHHRSFPYLILFLQWNVLFLFQFLSEYGLPTNINSNVHLVDIYKWPLERAWYLIWFFKINIKNQICIESKCVRLSKFVDLK
jgi:hypothetical protein